MKSKFLGLMLAGLFAAALPSVAQAADFDTIVDFRGGDGATAARFYFPAGQDMRIVGGMSINSPMDTDGKETGYEARLGLEANFPIIGTAEVTAGFHKSTMDGSDTNPTPIKLTKNAIFNITKDIKVGVSVDLLTIGVDADETNGKHVGILTNIYPVVGTTIRF